MQAIVGVGLARAVVPTEYGVVAAVAGAVLLWFIICDVGVSSCLGRLRAVSSKADVESALFVNLACAIGGAALAIVVVTVLALPHSAELAVALVLIVLAQALDKNIDGALAIPIADGELRFPSASALLRRVITAVTFFGLLLVGLDPLIAYGTGVALGPAAGQIQMWRKLSSMGLRRHHGGRAGWILRSSAPFALNDVAIQSRNVDVSLVAVSAGPGVAGLYAAAAKLTAPFQLVTSTLAGVILPRAARAERGVIRRGAVVIMAGALIMMVPMAFIAWYAEPLVVLVLGTTYAAAGPAFALLVLALPSVGAGAPLASMLQGLGQERLVAVHSAVFAVLILAAVALGSIAGATGAAAGFAVTTVVKTASLAAIVLLSGDRRRQVAEHADRLGAKP
ncbi:lipopolysaccharide biosynthesis protein [Pseudonocardia sp. KRD-184]|uniref:Lipopolysaccharide biosynthesis protein n=1 Tax=Pseudonocardia oceani TaxID=2792013 RepID=A0ABS6U5I7_9PSEU|nr:oligosaccharide flippase family protein [Pseudonocardia oceani]MBW0091337.1 lipopolysaccharide biosynthesis protein [Pseudonocardia oceani]MBW0098416.1 lipopolysaccharide biosynthesis protein [Pseudonocardia oceani]MBW0125003.1 lipopolysaccharide biosynthesis protein [Pseudonocardia oceani]MBW0127490.1 lipopolysaccharide biosynthesis protein [Pseudonocardia oceani]